MLLVEGIIKVVTSGSLVLLERGCFIGVSNNSFVNDVEFDDCNDNLDDK